MSCRVICVGLLLIGVLAAPVVRAEGGCPPGMYPIGGQGVRGCAPIPGAQQPSGASASPSAPASERLTGEWVKTWGALAGAIEGKEGGAAVGAFSERTARSRAIENCEKRAGGPCKVEFVYQNQCVAAVVSELASTGTNYVSAATVKEATQSALQNCRNKGGSQCRSIYSACSEPFFKRY